MDMMLWGSLGTQGLTDARLALLKKSKVKKINLVFDTDKNHQDKRLLWKSGETLCSGIGFHRQFITLPREMEPKKLM